MTVQTSTAFARDEHIPDLLLFAPQTSFQEDPAYLSGKVILQDKASCIPAFVLSPPSHEKTVAIDATAAPGNKTSHLSALMKGKGKVRRRNNLLPIHENRHQRFPQLYAFERDGKRFETLKTMLQKAACDNVEPVKVDFLTIDPSDSKYQPVTHM